MKKLILFPIIGFLLTLILIILKAEDVIDWHWVFYCLPVFITWGISIIYLAGMFFITYFCFKS